MLGFVPLPNLQICDRAGFDFLSNVPQAIQDVIEVDDSSPLPIPINSSDSASLLATSPYGFASVYENSINDVEFIFDRSIANARTFDVSSFKVSFDQISSFQISPFKVGFDQSSTEQESILEVSPFKVSPTQIDFGKMGFSQISSLKNGIPEIAAVPETNVAQVGITEIGSIRIDPSKTRIAQVSTSQISTSQISTSQVDATQFDVSQVSIAQFKLSEISFASSISPEQFFSIHKSTPQIINELNNSATNIWSDLLQSETQLEIDFQITDLPKGQLAEATITDFDSSGKPNAGTILIDHDDNDVGWFIDETPLDNSEFTAQNSNPTKAINRKLY